jgi:hypothetical protein
VVDVSLFGHVVPLGHVLHLALLQIAVDVLQEFNVYLYIGSSILKQSVPNLVFYRPWTPATEKFLG